LTVEGYQGKFCKAVPPKVGPFRYSIETLRADQSLEGLLVLNKNLVWYRANKIPKTASTGNKKSLSAVTHLSFYLFFPSKVYNFDINEICL